MIDLSHHHFTADKARTLLRRLRDLNLRSGPIAIRENLTATLAGCSSLDAPAESGVRYRVRVNGVADALMELAWTAAGLELALTGLGMPSRNAEPVTRAPNDVSTRRGGSDSSSRKATQASGRSTNASHGSMDASQSSTHASQSSTSAKLCLPVTCDRQGRACVRKLGARVSPDSTDERQLEHFLRRALRTLLH